MKVRSLVRFFVITLLPAISIVATRWIWQGKAGRASRGEPDFKELMVKANEENWYASVWSYKPRLRRTPNHSELAPIGLERL